MSKANEKQVGGSHYQAVYQHWDMVIEHDLNYFEGQITKYVMRARKKNGLQDLQKAQHFLEKYMEEWEQLNRVSPIEVEVIFPDVDDIYERQLAANAYFQADGFTGDGNTRFQCVACRQVVVAKSPLSAYRAHACTLANTPVL